MKKIFRLNQLYVSLMILGCSFGLASCDNDNNTPAEPATTDAWGEFKGSMTITPPSPELVQTDGTVLKSDVEATVKNDTVYFNNFPIKDLVANLVPQDQVDNIVKAIGQVKYKVGYKAALNAAKDSVYMQYDPKPLALKVPLSEQAVLDVKVIISAMEKGSYELSSKNYKFDIKADKVTVNEGNFDDFPVSIFNFSMKKK